MKMTMADLESCFAEAKNSGARYVGILVEMEGFPKPEAIINQIENADSKLEYYKKTYDDELNHKFAKGIKIVDCTYGFMDEIDEEFYR